MPRSTKRRARRSPQHWTELLAAYDARTTSADDFCDQRGVTSSSVQDCRKKLAAAPTETRPTAPSNRIVPVRIEAPAVFELVVPSGFVLRFYTSIDAASLRAVLLALESR